MTIPLKPYISINIVHYTGIVYLLRGVLVTFINRAADLYAKKG